MDHQGFARTIYALSKPGARAVLSFNNPYSSLVIAAAGSDEEVYETAALPAELRRRGFPSDFGTS